MIVDDGRKARLVLRNDSASRNLLLNVFLYAELSTKRNGPNGVLFSCLANPPLSPNCVVCQARGGRASPAAAAAASTGGLA